MARKRLTVAVVGATGAVGTEMLRVLKDRKFPIAGLRLLASERSAGKKIAFNGSSVRVEKLENKSFNGVDVALFSAGAGRSLEFAPEAVKRGAIVVDNSSAFRMDPHVPLVVPEVNPDALRGHRGIIANPNCSTIVMLVALKPLHDAATIRHITVATYQSVSGAGARAMYQLVSETRDALRGLKVLDRGPKADAPIDVRVKAGSARTLPQQIAFNLIPQVDVFLDNGYTKEEMKLVNETRKILGVPDMPVSATCVRVPVFMSHSEAIWIQTERWLSPAEAYELLRKAPGVTVVDGRKGKPYPMPIDSAGQDNVHVGRIRVDDSVENGLTLWACGDNLRKGAATNAVQIAELLFSGK